VFQICNAFASPSAKMSQPSTHPTSKDHLILTAAKSGASNELFLKRQMKRQKNAQLLRLWFILSLLSFSESCTAELFRRNVSTAGEWRTEQGSGVVLNIRAAKSWCM